MAKSRKKQRIEAKRKKQEAKFIRVVVIATLILVVAMYFILF